MIQEFLYSKDFVLVSLPGLSSGDKIQGYAHVEWKHSALIASTPNVIPVNIHSITILTGACFCTGLYEK